jgi:ubiquinol-cytochrome c reductase iron-sulfur subunit
MTDINGSSEEPQNDDGRARSGRPDPGAPPHRVIGTPVAAESRTLLPTDEADPVEPVVDEDEEKAAKKAERVVAAFFLLAFFASVAFIVYFIGWSGRNDGVTNGMHGIDRARESNLVLGGTMTVSFLAIAVGVTIWVRRLMTAKQIVQERHELASPEADRQVFTENFLEGAEASGITKRPLLRRTLLLAAAPLGLAPLLLLRDLGPLPEKKLRFTYWRDAVDNAKKAGKPGVRLLVDGTGRPLKASDFNTPGGMITVVPEGIEKTPDPVNELAKAATIVINIPVGEFKPVKGRENWHVEGIVAYSKICTHVGCPAALYEQTTHHILCPCHQSTFDATNGAKVLFGPAARALPQLPISVDSEGYLIATSDYKVPVGPSFWERGATQQ